MTGTKLHRIEQSMDVRCTPESIYRVITDPGYVSQYAAGIEGAQITEPGPDGLVGRRIEMMTRGGRTLNATVKEAQQARLVVMEDENGLRSTWRIEPLDDDRCRLTNILEGTMDGERARRIAYDADVKFQEFARSLEAPGEDRHEGEGASDVVGTPMGPRKE